MKTRAFRVVLALGIAILVISAPGPKALRPVAAETTADSVWPTTKELLAHQTVAQLVEHDVPLRKDLGFRADANYVAGLYSNSELHPKPRYLNILLTADEESEAAVRQELAADNDTIVTYLRANSILGSFGGSYIDHSGGGLLVVHFVGNNSATEDLLISLVKHKQRIRVRDAAYSLSDLARWAEGVHHFRSELRERHGVDVMATVPDPRVQAVVVTTSAGGDWDGAVATISSELGVPTAALARDPQVAYTRTKLHGSALYAAERLATQSSPTSPFCSSGFAVLPLGDPLGGNVLSSGHCWQTNQRVIHSSVDVGFVAKRQDSGDVDAANVKLSAGFLGTSNAIGGPTGIRVIDKEIAFDPTEFSIGYRCVSGGFSGLSCGNLQGVSNYGNNTNMRRLSGIAPIVQGGDSGSPVWCPIPNAGGVGVVASGLVESKDSTYVYYSHIAAIEFALLVEVRTF